MKKLVLSLAVVLGVGTLVSCGGSKAEEKDSCADTTCTEAEAPVVCDSADTTVACDSPAVDSTVAE